MTQENQSPEPLDDVLAQAGTVEVSDLDEFVRTLCGWHQNQVAQMKHMLDIPEGETLELNEEMVELKGEAHKAFLAGITVGLSLLGTLPFVAEMEDEPTIPANDPTEAFIEEQRNGPVEG